MTENRCSDCGRLLPVSELHAVIPRGRPSGVFFICRPASGRMCFAHSVGVAADFYIEPAVFAARLAA